MAIRTKNHVSLALPPMFWKKLTNEVVSSQDLKNVDECCYQFLEILNNLEA